MVKLLNGKFVGKTKEMTGNSVGKLWDFTQIFPTFSLSHNSVPAPVISRQALSPSCKVGHIIENVISLTRGEIQI